MRLTSLATCLTLLPVALSAQVDATPSRLAEVELERSRSCVGTLAEVRVLDASLSPLVARGQRLRMIAQAVGLEDRSMVAPLDANDATESMVLDWFTTDAALAQRYLTTENEALLSERTAGRETIKAVVTQAITAVQAEANELLTTNQELLARAAPCDGAIFVRSAVQEACATSSGPICEQAGLPPGQAPDFRFVEAPESVWEIADVRPWSVPGPLQPNAQGQLDGGRTVGYARVGNVVVSVSFSPLLRARADVAPEVLASYEAINDSLGLTIDHPDVAVAPSIGIRAALPIPLGTETRYAMHFGTPDAPDVVWTAPAGTGAALEEAVALGATHVRRLRAGEPLMLTAFGGPDADQPEYSIEISAVNQAPATTVLLNYMSTQLSQDLRRYIQPNG